MPGAALDLSQLPPPAAIEVLSFDALVAAIKVDLLSRRPAIAAVLALESEPVVKLLEAFAYREFDLRNRINQVALADTLAFSTGDDLVVMAGNLGVQKLAGENDDDFRARAVLAAEGWSTAGPAQAYLFHARSADARVSDAAVSSPQPGVVRVVVLSTTPDGVASADLLATVNSALNADEIRPLTDQVEVVSADVAPWNVSARLKILSGPDSSSVEAAARAAVVRYGQSRRKLNKGVAVKGVIAALMQPGVEDLELLAPLADIEPNPEIAPVLGSVDLTFEVAA
ncbi:baseplate J/gp47 family protein [uncultured Brevundimonas sp.]|uniref:baseplate assembly protein n=1 Tax=uncultured Brevundimonas sp. TaxID=213418 RepID=UPI0025E6383A|nr:baseplate J/gp47 family protein [uncultured Brevundimonas sp.]